MRLTDPVTGAQARVFLFVATLPFSRYAFVEPTVDMRQDTWLRAHVAMFEWLGGSVPRIVPDNLKTGVIKHPSEGEVVLNDAYRELAGHYSAAVLPGRVRKPKEYPGDCVIPRIRCCCWLVSCRPAISRDSYFSPASWRIVSSSPFQSGAGSGVSLAAC